MTMNTVKTLTVNTDHMSCFEGYLIAMDIYGKMKDVEAPYGAGIPKAQFTVQSDTRLLRNKVHHTLWCLPSGKCVLDCSLIYSYPIFINPDG